MNVDNRYGKIAPLSTFSICFDFFIIKDKREENENKNIT